MYILSDVLQNVTEVNRECTRIVAVSSINILSLDIKEQLSDVLQNVTEVNRELTRNVGASSIIDSTRKNGLLTIHFNTKMCFY